MASFVNDPLGIHRRIEFDVTDSLKRRFMARVDKSASDKCWNWTGSVRNGYGAIKHQRKVLGTHRLAYVLSHGDVPEGMIVGHKCDNKLCCNPSHLEAISPGKNNRDARGRLLIHNHARGEETPNAKLSDAIVKKIWELHGKGMGYTKISREIGQNKYTIKGVLERRTWVHLAPK